MRETVNKPTAPIVLGNYAEIQGTRPKFGHFCEVGICRGTTMMMMCQCKLDQIAKMGHIVLQTKKINFQGQFGSQLDSYII
jgi:hypothetical protein